MTANKQLNECSVNTETRSVHLSSVCCKPSMGVHTSAESDDDTSATAELTRFRQPKKGAKLVTSKQLKKEQIDNHMAPKGVKAKSLSASYRIFQTNLSPEVLNRVDEYWRIRDAHVVNQDRPRPDLAASSELRPRVMAEGAYKVCLLPCGFLLVSHRLFCFFSC